MTVLSARDQALARSRLYGLLAKLIIRGVDEPALAQLEALGWDSFRSSDHGHSPGELLDELAAEHHTTFSLGVFPYAGVFLDPLARAGGCADQVRAHYERAGFSPRLDELSADHLGVELAFLSFVTGAQGDALEDDRPAIAAALDRQLAEFLDACVLSYLPALLAAAQELASAGYWARMLGETLTLVAEHRARLPGPVVATVLASAGDLLADERTGLRRIAEHLLTPAASGVFLSRTDIAALGRARELPRGFGSRVLMLDNLLRSAVEYGELAPLLAALDEGLVRRDHSLAAIATVCEIDPAVAPWRDALAQSRTLIDRIARSALALDLEDHQDQADQPWTSKPSTTTQPAP